MNKPEIFVSKVDEKYKVKVTGRVTFAVAPTLRNLVQRITSDANVSAVSINLSECTGMDSTFMGILAMLALKVRSMQLPVQIVNAGEPNKKLLNGLGLNKLFEYVEISDTDNQNWEKAKKQESSFKENAETILNAHKTLIETDVGNIDKFKNVVEQIENELN